MRIDGTLTKWNDKRGFGFISPRRGGNDIFVHISAFPKDGIRPLIGEALSFEIATESRDKKRAINVYRPRRKNTISSRKSNNVRSQKKNTFISPLVTLAILLALGGYGYTRYSGRTDILSPLKIYNPIKNESQREDQNSIVSFRCDGRTRCSQMTSCDEAKFFLRNCPSVQMDGANDGIPCEKQWCTGFLGN